MTWATPLPQQRVCLPRDPEREEGERKCQRGCCRGGRAMCGLFREAGSTQIIWIQIWWATRCSHCVSTGTYLDLFCASGQGNWRRKLKATEFHWNDEMRLPKIGFNSRNRTEVNIYRHGYSAWSRINISRIYVGASLSAGWIRNPPRARAFTGDRICKDENFNEQLKAKRNGKTVAWQGILGLLLVK